MRAYVADGVNIHYDSTHANQFVSDATLLNVEAAHG